jgi:hypothetical protein
MKIRNDPVPSPCLARTDAVFRVRSEMICLAPNLKKVAVPDFGFEK